LIFIVTIIGGVLFSTIISNFEVDKESIIVMYISSGISVLLSGYSYYYYLKNHD